MFPTAPRRCAARLAATVAVAVSIAVAVGAGCSSSSSEGSGAAPATTVPPSYATVADLAKTLQSKGISCTLEYEGLRQEDKTLSICVVDGEQATLTIWDHPDVLAKFLAAPVTGTGATAVGANWTIDVDTAATAQKLTAALGGQVKAPEASGPGTTA
jgi:hypothetical protein